MHRVAATREDERPTADNAIQAPRPDLLPEIRQHAEAIAARVRGMSDLEPTLADIERQARSERHVTSFHTQAGLAAIRKAYEGRPPEEYLAKVIEFSRRMNELSFAFDPPNRVPEIHHPQIAMEENPPEKEP